MSDDQNIKSPKMEPSSSSPSATGAQNGEARTVASGDQVLPRTESSPLKRGLDDDLADDSKRCKGDILQKMKHSQPYGFFLSSIADEENTHDEMLTLSFPELFDERLGVIESSLQLTFKIDIEWLLAQYAVNNEKLTPITLVYGFEDRDLLQTDYLAYNAPSHVTANYVKLHLRGHHHTKMMILSYTDGSIRVVVMTGNLVEIDWKNTIQGIWVSPRLPRIESGPTGADVSDSDTHFKKDLLDYLAGYKLPAVEPWIEKVKNADCREVKVFFIASMYGTHEKNASVKWGLPRMAQLLSEHAIIPEEEAKNWPLYCQSSSFGNLGRDPSDWLLSVFTNTMQKSSGNSLITPDVKVIYPCNEDVISSYDGEEGGRVLPYDRKVHEGQSWFKNFLCKWRCDSRHRTRAMPHIKTYCRISPCKNYLSWFLLTSANLTKAAWGMELKNEKYRIHNHEAGVLFIPQHLIAKSRFPLTNQSPSEDGPQFSLPYDLPLVNYAEEDEPWFYNVLHNRQYLT